MIKKTLLLIPLLALVSCTGSIVLPTNNVTKDTEREKYTNVIYDFDREKCNYKVLYFDNEQNIYTKEWVLEPSNLFYVYISGYIFDENDNIIYNEYYTNPNQLFVYLRQ